MNEDRATRRREKKKKQKKTTKKSIEPSPANIVHTPHTGIHTFKISVYANQKPAFPLKIPKAKHTQALFIVHEEQQAAATVACFVHAKPYEI